MKKDEKGELMELSHDAEPGYRPVFFIVLVIAAVYLAATFVFDLHH
jgi:hypothetical protein